jgi:hypothetical protein
VLDDDLPHRARGEREEMSAVAHRLAVAVAEAEVELVHERGRRQCRAGQAAQRLAGAFPELRIHDAVGRIGRAGVAGLRGVQKIGQLPGCRHRPDGAASTRLSLLQSHRPVRASVAIPRRACPLSTPDGV